MADSKTSRVIVGADHFGLPLKNAVREHLIEQGYEVVDIGVGTEDPVDYPDIAEALANKVPGVIAVQVGDPYTAERARASNNAQIITFGAQTTGPKVATALVDIFMKAEFQGGRSAPKVDKILAVDRRHRRSRADAS